MESQAGSILESKRAKKKKGRKVQKSVKKGQKRATYLNILAKIYKNRKYFEKGQVIACDYRF